MKNTILYLSLLLLTAMAGCNKFLDKEPDNRAKLNSPEKVSQLLATAYPGANYMAFAESSTDNVADRANSNTPPNETRDPYMFKNVRSTFEDSPEFYWHGCYKAIAASNLALQAIEAAPDKQNYASQKGEALVTRAYAHFMLVNFFSKFYDPSTDNSSPGIPYVTEPENVVIKQYERKTVKYVYDMIEKDLLEGLPLIKDEAYVVPAYHFTRIATNAFAARFYLFKKDYAKVLSYTSQVVPTTAVASKLRPWNTSYAAMTRLELFNIYTRAIEPANLLLCETTSVYGRFIYDRFGYHVNTFRAIGIEVPVITTNTVTAQWQFAYQSYGGDNLVYIPKLNEYFVRVSVNAEIGNAYIMAPLFTMEEALFNRAEALTYTGNATEAISLLNNYLSTRVYFYTSSLHTLTAAKITAAYPGTLQNGLINTILAYKRMEFIHEGMRWFDILRYNIPVTHFVAGDTSPYSLTEEKKVFQLPQTAVLSGLQLNPRKD